MTRVLYEGHPTAIGVTTTRGSSVCFAGGARAHLDVEYLKPGEGRPGGALAPGSIAPGQGDPFFHQASAAGPGQAPGG